MFNPFKRKSIADNAKDFEMQYKIAMAIIFVYLSDWFKQISENHDRKKIFGEVDLHATLAARVEGYLFGEDLEEVIKKASSELKEKILTVKDYIPKWTDHVMNEDKNLSE